MFRIAICDDQDDSLRLIDRAVTRYFSERSDLQADISRFDNPLEFLNALHSSGGWDIVILDVCMPEVNGTEIAREIRNRHDRTEIIFISYSTEYAVEAFALNAVHYVLKPLNEKDFREAMDRAIKPFSEREKKTIMLLLANGVVQAVDIKEILYIESVAYRRLVHTSTTLYEETRRRPGSLWPDFTRSLTHYLQDSSFSRIVGISLTSMPYARYQQIGSSCRTVISFSSSGVISAISVISSSSGPSETGI